MTVYHDCLETIRLDTLLWPEEALYRVVYSSYSLDGERELLPTNIYFSTDVALDLWLFDQFTDTLQDAVCFKARVYHRKDGAPQFVKDVTYP
jgi:hypothetical protein